MSVAPTTPIVDVFVSYKREDRPRVLPIVDGLRQTGLQVWWDGDIPGGANWRRTLTDHLDSARCVIVVWSEGSTSAAGEFVQEEASHAKSRHVLLPLRIDDVTEPLGYGEIQSIDLINWPGDIEDPRFKALVVSAEAMFAGRSRPEPIVGRTSPRDRSGWFDRAIAGARGYIVDLVDLISGPKRFLARRLANEGGTLEEALRFLGISFLLVWVLELPLSRGNPLSELLVDATFVGAYVLLFGCAAYWAWRLVGGTTAIQRFLIVHFYLSALVKMTQTAFYVTARGVLRSDRGAYDEIMASLYRGDYLWVATNGDRLIAHRAVQLSSVLLLGGWAASLIWLLLGWGAYRELTGLPKSRSVLAFLLFCILSVPVYLLTTLISAALIS